MVSAIVRKSMRDLSKRRARTVFTVLTVALGVMGIGLFAIFPMADEGASGVVEEQRLHNLMITVSDVALSAADAQALGAIDNVDGFEARAVYYTQMFIGERKNDVYIVGVEDFAHQHVDVVELDSGRAPGAFEALTDRSNAVNGVYDGGEGDSFRVVDHKGSEVELSITGVGGTLAYSAASFAGYAVFATDVGTVRALGNISGYNLLSFTLASTDDAVLDATVEDIRTYLTDHTSVVAFSDLPDVWKEGQWPGRDMLSNLVSMLYVLTVLALLCSVFLISNTMNTMILEQRREIAQMKAIGARRAQVFRSFLTTSFVIGTVGAVAGAVLGVVMANFVLGVLGGPFGFAPGFSVHLPTFLMSLVVGVGIVLVASLPALSRSTKVVVREGLEGHGISADFGSGALDRLLMRGAGLPRAVQMGLRNVARKKGRSAATALQVALAVGVLLGLLSFGQSLSVAVSDTYKDLTWDVAVATQSFGGVPLNESLRSDIEAIDNVRSAEPFIETAVQLNGRTVVADAYAHDTVSFDYEGTMDRGRWFTEEEDATLARVIVVGPALVELEGLDLGDTVELTTATGSDEFTVVGVSNGLMANGQIIYMPLSTVQDVLRLGDDVTGFFVKVEDAGHDAIDATATRMEDALLAMGFVVDTMVLYVMEERNQQSNQVVIDLMLVISLIVVLISLIGLMSTLTMNIIDRTREIGMMRCLGSRARDIRRMFSSEGALLSLLGWLVGVPLGLLIANVVTEVVADQMKLRIPLEFPLGFVLWSFVVAMVGTVVITQAPLLRATRLRPGDALRYQ
jgi:putative ABC transport system permease protein